MGTLRPRCSGAERPDLGPAGTGGAIAEVSTKTRGLTDGVELRPWVGSSPLMRTPSRKHLGHQVRGEIDDLTGRRKRSPVAPWESEYVA
jgi:hypothetical protein